MSKFRSCFAVVVLSLPLLIASGCSVSAVSPEEVRQKMASQPLGENSVKGEIKVDLGKFTKDPNAQKFVDWTRDSYIDRFSKSRGMGSLGQNLEKFCKKGTWEVVDIDYQGAEVPIHAIVRFTGLCDWRQRDSEFKLEVKWTVASDNSYYWDEYLYMLNGEFLDGKRTVGIVPCNGQFGDFMDSVYGVGK